MPKGVTWIRGAAAAVDPAAQQVTTESGQLLGYDYLAMAQGCSSTSTGFPGSHGPWASAVSPATTATTWPRRPGSSSAACAAAPRCSPCRPARSSARGAPQKIAYLAADWWRSQGVLDRVRVILVLPTATMFSQPDWARVLTGIAADYGIEVRLESQVVEVDGDARRAVIADARADTKEEIG